MKKLFLANSHSGKICRRGAAVLMSAVMAVCLCSSVQAASDSGTIGGASCSASLSVGSNTSASTVSSLSAYHSASVSFNFYYTDGDGVSHIDTVTAQNNNSDSVTAVAYGHQNNI